MIDSKKLYGWIKAQINPYGKPFEGTIFEFGNKVLDHIKAMEKQPKTECSECTRRKFYQKGYQDGLNAGKWIPCEVEMPPQPKKNQLYENKPLQIYLVSVKNCEKPIRAFWNGKYFTDGWSKLNVEAWMNLPQPYKKEGAENGEP